MDEQTRRVRYIQCMKTCIFSRFLLPGLIFFPLSSHIIVIGLGYFMYKSLQLWYILFSSLSLTCTISFSAAHSIHPIKQGLRRKEILENNVLRCGTDKSKTYTYANKLHFRPPQAFQKKFKKMKKSSSLYPLLLRRKADAKMITKYQTKNHHQKICVMKY